MSLLRPPLLYLDNLPWARHSMLDSFLQPACLTAKAAQCSQCDVNVSLDNLFHSAAKQKKQMGLAHTSLNVQYFLNKCQFSQHHICTIN